MNSVILSFVELKTLRFVFANIRIFVQYNATLFSEKKKSKRNGVNASSMPSKFSLYLRNDVVVAILYSLFCVFVEFSHKSKTLFLITRRVVCLCPKS